MVSSPGTRSSYTRPPQSLKHSSTESDPFVQSITNDVLTNNMRRELKRSILHNHFPNSGQNRLSDYRLFQANYGGTVYASSSTGSKAFIVLIFCALGFSTTDYGMILRLQLLGSPFVICEGKRTILPSPIQTSTVNSRCASSQGQPSLNEQHSLREQGYVRVIRRKFLNPNVRSTIRERKTVK